MPGMMLNGFKRPLTTLKSLPQLQLMAFALSSGMTLRQSAIGTASVYVFPRGSATSEDIKGKNVYNVHSAPVCDQEPGNSRAETSRHGQGRPTLRSCDLN